MVNIVELTYVPSTIMDSRGPNSGTWYCVFL